MSAPAVAFVQSSWHADLVASTRTGFLDEVERLRPGTTVDVVDVPGALELPLRAQLLAETGRYDAIVAAGLVVDGGIYRHEFVASAVIDGLVRVGLDTRVPVLSVVLTPQQFHEHEDHHRFFAAHLVGKGTEAAVACLASIDGTRAARELAPHH